MFNIGFPELIIILIVALLVVGPAKLPEVARTIGKALGEFRRMADDVKDSLEEEVAKEEDKKEPPSTSTEQASQTGEKTEQAMNQTGSETEKEASPQSVHSGQEHINPAEQKKT